MAQRGICWIAIVCAAFVVTGCGSGGIDAGIPKQTTGEPVNPTPDMGPTPPGKDTGGAPAAKP